MLRHTSYCSQVNTGQLPFLRQQWVTTYIHKRCRPASLILLNKPHHHVLKICRCSNELYLMTLHRSSYRYLFLLGNVDSDKTCYINKTLYVDLHDNHCCNCVRGSCVYIRVQSMILVCSLDLIWSFLFLYCISDICVLIVILFEFILSFQSCYIT